MLPYIRFRDFLAPRMLAALAVVFTTVAAFVVTFAAAASIDAWLDARVAPTLLFAAALFAAALVAIGIAGVVALLWIHDALTRLRVARAQAQEQDAWLSRQWIPGGMPE